MKYTIRVAKESDIGCFFEMRLALQSHVEKSNPDIWRLSDKGRKQLKEQSLELISDPDVQVLLALNNEEYPIGMIVGRINRNPKSIPNITASIEMLFVREGYRRHGVGTKLVLTLCEFFSSRGAEDISVRYVAGSSEGEGFWTQFGFKPRIVTAGVRRQLLKDISIAKFEE